MQIRYTRRAVRHLASLRRYSTNQFGTAITDDTLARIRSAIDDLEVHPRRGCPGRVAETRELIIPGLPFIAAYRITATTIDVLAILHAARRWPEDLR